MESEGIVQQKTNPYTLEQIGLAERSNRANLERTTCLLFGAEWNEIRWVEAI